MNSGIYDEVFYSEPFVTITYLDSWRIQDIQEIVNL